MGTHNSIRRYVLLLFLAAVFASFCRAVQNRWSPLYRRGTRIVTSVDTLLSNQEKDARQSPRSEAVAPDMQEVVNTMNAEDRREKQAGLSHQQASYKGRNDPKFVPCPNPIPFSS